MDIILQKFLDIIKIVKYIVHKFKYKKINSAEDVFEADKLSRLITKDYILKKNGIIK